jgi:hypothetical protein
MAQSKLARESSMVAGGKSISRFSPLCPTILACRSHQKSADMSLSREFASFVAGLRYEDLPPEVVDRAKGATLQALASALIGRNMPASRQALALMLVSSCH